MKILIIIYNYYPVMRPRSLRWSAIAEELVKKGINVDVVSSNNNKRTERETLHGVQIYRTNNFLTSSKLPSEPLNNLNTEKSFTLLQKINNNIFKFFKPIIKLIYNYTIKNIYWPDSNFLWYFPAIRLSKKLINLNNYNNIITVSLPFTCNLIGLSLKKKYPKINWMTDNGDPFCFSHSSIKINNKFLYNKINHLIESKVFRYANSLSYTNSVTCEKYAEKFNEYSSKIILIPPLVKINKNFKTVNVDEYFTICNKKIIISYFGLLYKGLRTPKKLLDLIKNIATIDNKTFQKIELHFFGDHMQCVDDFEDFNSMKEKIFFHKMLNKETALSAMKKSDILINIGNKTSYQLPSKIVEYVSLKKPILNICSIKNDLSAIYLKEFEFVHSYYDNEKNAYNFIKNFKKVNFNKDQIKKFENLHSAEFIANSYLEYL
jgi:hypothetical protein